MPSATFSEARLYVLKRGTSSTGPFTTVAGLNNLVFNGSTAMDDVTTKEDLGWSANAPGRKTAQITASGICRTNSSVDVLRASWLNASEDFYQIVDKDGEGYEGTFVISSFSLTGAIDGAITFEVTLQNLGPVEAVTP